MWLCVALHNKGKYNDSLHNGGVQYNEPEYNEMLYSQHENENLTWPEDVAT